MSDMPSKQVTFTVIKLSNKTWQKKPVSKYLLHYLHIINGGISKILPNLIMQSILSTLFFKYSIIYSSVSLFYWLYVYVCLRKWCWILLRNSPLYTCYLNMFEQAENYRPDLDVFQTGVPFYKMEISCTHKNLLFH